MGIGEVASASWIGLKLLRLGVHSPGDPCTQIVHTLALYSPVVPKGPKGTLGPKYILFGYMDPWG